MLKSNVPTNTSQKFLCCFATFPQILTQILQTPLNITVSLCLRSGLSTAPCQITVTTAACFFCSPLISHQTDGCWWPMRLKNLLFHPSHMLFVCGWSLIVALCTFHICIWNIGCDITVHQACHLSLESDDTVH